MTAPFHLFWTVLVVALGILTGCVSLTPMEEITARLPADAFVTVPPPDLPDAAAAPRRIHVLRSGSADGEPVLLLHGFGASGHAYRELMALWTSDSDTTTPRLLAPDLYGFGFTSRPHDRVSYTRSGQVSLLLSLLDALEIDSAHVVGHSYGGAIALAFAGRNPERVRSLVLLDSAHPRYPQARRRGVVRIPGLSTVYTRVLALRRGAVREGLERSFYDDSLATPERVERYLGHLRVEGVARGYKGLTVPQEDPGPDTELETIETPTLVLWGREDPLISVEGGRRATERMPRSFFYDLPRVGHVPHEEAPGTVATALRAWLDWLRRGADPPPLPPDLLPGGSAPPPEAP